MATAVENTPKWFDAEFYLTNKLAMLRETEPSANWTREMLNKAFVDNGFSNPYDHYLAYGDIETLNPNALFDANEYVAAKAAQLGSTWTAEMVKQAIKDAGMTLAEHYTKYGFMEGLNPSSGFDQNKYLDAKLEQLLAEDPKGEWTIAKVRESLLANGITPLEHYMVYGKMEGLQDPKYDYSVNGNPIPHPGSDIALTTGTDEVGPKGAEGFVTSSRDDLITGVVSSTSSRGTFNNTDVIDGAEGRDVLKLDMQSDFGGFKDGAGVKNVETIVLDNAGGHTFNAKGVEGAGQYVVDLGSKIAAIKNVDTAATAFVVSGDKGAKLNVQFTDAALAGKSDVSHVVLNSVGEDVKDGAVEVKVGGASAAAKLESLVLHSNGTGNFVTVAGEHDAVSVMGDADITLTTGANLKTFDASAALGDVKANLSSSSATVTSVLGGEGNDTVIVSSLKSGAVLNGGAGKDTLRFEGITSGVALKNTISDFETFVFKEGSAAAANVIDMTNITGLTSIQYEAGTTSVAGNDVFTVKNSSLSEFTFAMQDHKADADLGSLAALNYAGAGSLNLSMYGEDGSATMAGIKGLSANNVDTLNISSTNDKTIFAVADITAKSVEQINVDTNGGKGVALYADYTIPGNLASLTSIVFQGSGEGGFEANSTVNKLTSVDASELKGALTMDLGGITPAGEKGVDIYVGSGGSSSETQTITLRQTNEVVGEGIVGTTKGDTFHLNNSEKDVLRYTNANQSLDKDGSGVDVVNGFDATVDRIAFKPLLFGWSDNNSLEVPISIKFLGKTIDPDAVGDAAFKTSDSSGSHTFAYGYANGETYLFVNVDARTADSTYDLDYDAGKDMLIKLAGEIDFGSGLGNGTIEFY